MLEVAILGSGSTGNAAVIADGETSVLVDAGLSVRELERRLSLVGRSSRELAAVLVTHEHRDHAGWAGRFCERHHRPVYMTALTRSVAELGGAEVRVFESGARFRVGTIEVQAVPIPHLAADPVAFVAGSNGRSAGILTDLGCLTSRIRQAFRGLDVLVLEANHDPELLRLGRYPEFLKRSIGGDRGHLSNLQAASAAAELATDRTQQVFLAHLSEENNRPELAVRTVRRALESRLFSPPIAALPAHEPAGPVTVD